MFSRRTRNIDSRFGYYLGFYSKKNVQDGNYRMYWQFPGNKDVEHVTLGTKDREAVPALIAAFVMLLGRNDSDKANDPHVVAVVRHFVETLKGDNSKTAKSRRSNLKRLTELLIENYPDVTMSQFTRGMQKKLIAKMAPRWDVHSVRQCMVSFGAAVTYACERDDNNNVFSDHWVDVVMSRNTICDLIDRDPPEVMNWHPDPAGMAQVLRELRHNESARRWAFLALYTGLRPSHILELNQRMITSVFDTNTLDTRCLRATATDENKAISGFFRSQLSYIKRRPQLPLPSCIQEEISTWGEGAWVNASYEQIRGSIRAAGDKLGMPLLIPSSFRDFCKGLIEFSGPHLQGPAVPPRQCEIWMGHRVTTKVHAGYGLSHPGGLKEASDAVVHYMKWLDGETGGVLFRQASAKSASANCDNWEADIRPQPVLASEPSTLAATLLQSSQIVEKQMFVSELRDASAKSRDALAGGRVNADADLAEAPTDLSVELPPINITDELSDGLGGEISGLIGAKLRQAGQFEGSREVFRRVTDGTPKGIWGNEFKRTGARFVLPNLLTWFRVVGIEIYETDTAHLERAQRVFVDQASQTIISASDVKARMIASLGREPRGWRKHSVLAATDGTQPDIGPFEYRDLDRRSPFPRGLLELVTHDSPLGYVRGAPELFREVQVSRRDPPADGGDIDWRFMLKNLQIYFDMAGIAIYDAELTINGQSNCMRFFVQDVTEEVISVEYLREKMIFELGCDPGGWSEHSKLGKPSEFDIDHFIATTSRWEELDEIHAFDPAEWDAETC